MSRIHFSNYDIFKSFAKKIQKSYKSNPDITKPLPLGSIRSICAHGFGYRNDHDLQQSISDGWHNDLALLTSEQFHEIGMRLEILARRNGSIVGVQSGADWERDVLAISESIAVHLQQISIEPNPLYVMTVQFFWPFTCYRDKLLEDKYVNDVLDALNASPQKGWQFLPSCSKRDIPSPDQESEDPIFSWEDLLRAMTSDSAGAASKYNAFTERFAEDITFDQSDSHLSTGVQTGVLVFAVPAASDYNDLQDVMTSSIDGLAGALNSLIRQLVGGRAPWLSIMPPSFNYVFGEVYDYENFYLGMKDGLKTVAEYSDSPEELKHVMLSTNGSITGRVIFNHQRADIYLPNYDAISDILPGDYDFLTCMEIYAKENIQYQCSGLKTRYYSFPSDCVGRSEYLDDCYNLLTIEGGEYLLQSKDTNWVLEGGAIICCPRYLMGYLEPDYNEELMACSPVESRTGASFLELVSHLVKRMDPTAMSAITYIESNAGGYFHVVAGIYSGDQLIAEESYSIYDFACEEGYPNGLFTSGDILHDRLSGIAEKLNIPFSSASSEFSYPRNLMGDECYVFAGMKPAEAQSSNRTGVILTILQDRIQKPLTNNQYQRILECVKKGLTSARVWALYADNKHIHWSIDKHSRSLSLPFQLGVYEKYMELYCAALKTAVASDSILDVDLMSVDYRYNNRGPFFIGLAFDGPEVITQEILIDWGRMAISDSLAEAFQGGAPLSNKTKANEDENQGVIPPFYEPMEREIRSILALTPESEIRVSFV